MATSSVDDDLFDTVAADFLARFRNGERPAVEDYTARHPDLADEIRELFPTMVAIERMKLQKELSSGGCASLGARQLERLGDFRIIREIGRGGMGVVFEAEQESLQRHVALKVLPPNALQDDSHIRRFHREAQTAARLHHTNIVPVFGVGEEDGLHYYVMQLIEGEPLDTQLQAGKREALDPRQAAEMVRQIADAVQFAHDHGTLHRDIKPANLLLDKSGNVWITDFGLAHVLEREETMTDHVAGTLRYMAPERFEGKADERSDQYSLGITLYELVTGYRAFEGASSGELLHRIAHGEPTRLTLLSPGIPRDLQTIIEKTISRDPSHRYGRVGDFAADLGRFLGGRPIHARPISSVERLWRWCRRNRALAASLASVAVLLVAVAVITTVAYIRATQDNESLQAALTDRDTALQSESAALVSERNAREQERLAREEERRSREAAEAITELALEGLDRVFDEFAPAAPYIAALSVSTGGMDDQEPLLLPAQTVVSPQAAAALERLLPLYRQLADETAQQPHVRLRAASAHYRLGVIHRQLGHQDSARAAFWSARSLLESLLEEGVIPVAELRLPLAQVLNDLGDLDRFLPNQFRERRSAHQEALSLLGSVSLSALSREERLQLARTHYYLGRRDGFFFRPPPGGTGRDGDGPTPGARPQSIGRPSAEPVARGNSGEARPNPDPESAEPPRRNDDRGRRGPFRGGLWFPAREEFTQHLSQAISLLEEFPQAERDTRVQLLLARCYREQAAQRGRDELDLRQADWGRAVTLLQGLVQDAPETPDFRFELSEAYADIEPRWVPDEALGDAELRLLDALPLSRQLVEESPDVPAYAAGLTQILVKLTNVFRRTNRTAEAEEYLREAVAQQTSLAERYPDSEVHLVWTARLKRQLADLYLIDEQFDDAVALLREAAQAIEPIVQSESRPNDPSMFFTVYTLGETYRTLADILRDQGDSDEAEAFDAKARELRPRNRSTPGDPRR
ncbi:MAG: protein kinase [Planctomycetaceae bacterium]|nr:protein kinase [Planctomycetaceae bacterium]